MHVSSHTSHRNLAIISYNLRQLAAVAKALLPYRTILTPNQTFQRDGTKLLLSLMGHNLSIITHRPRPMHNKARHVVATAFHPSPYVILRNGNGKVLQNRAYMNVSVITLCHSILRS